MEAGHLQLAEFAPAQVLHATVKVPLVANLVQPVVEDIGRRLDDIPAGHPQPLRSSRRSRVSIAIKQFYCGMLYCKVLYDIITTGC